MKGLFTEVSTGLWELARHGEAPRDQTKWTAIITPTAGGTGEEIVSLEPSKIGPPGKGHSHAGTHPGQK